MASSIVSLPGEIWKPVSIDDGFWVTRYEVSNLARIKSLPNPRCKHIKLLKVNYASVYPSIQLNKNKKAKSYSVHILVAHAFHGPRPEGRQVNHIDGDKTNNHAGNLEYVTPAQNMRHGVKIGLIQKGETHWKSKLSRKNVQHIIELWQRGMSQTEIADQYDVSQTHVSNIIKGRTWKHLERPQLLRESAYARKLRSGDLGAIRMAHAGGETQTSIASRYGITPSYVSKIVHFQQ